MTREDAKKRIGEIDAQLIRGVADWQRRKLVAEMTELRTGLGTNRFAAAAPVARSNVRAAGRGKAPLFVDDYTGPRCEFCGGPRPSLAGPCLQDGPSWPHPPEDRPQ